MSWWEDFFKEFEEFDKFFRRMMERAMRDLKEETGGPFVYGFTYYIGPDGKPVFREFGNVKPSDRGFIVQEEREPLVETYEEDDEIIVVAEVPGVSKENINLMAGEDELEISAETPERKYRKRVKLPAPIDPDSVKASYKNGVLEVRMKRKGGEKKRVKVE